MGVLGPVITLSHYHKIARYKQRALKIEIFIVALTLLFVIVNFWKSLKVKQIKTEYFLMI